MWNVECGVWNVENVELFSLSEIFVFLPFHQKPTFPQAKR